MKCEICNKDKTIFDKTEIEFKCSELPVKISGEFYNCECPVYYLDELCFIRDNNKNIRHIDYYTELIEHLKDRRNLISQIKEKIKISDTLIAMNVYKKKKDLKNDYIDQIDRHIVHNNKNIWKILYSL